MPTIQIFFIPIKVFINSLQKLKKSYKKPEDWFKANKLSLNNKKTKYTLFHKKSNKDDLPLKLPVLKIGNNQVQRKKAIKFLGVMLDENLDWQEHIRTIDKNGKKYWFTLSSQIFTK